MSAAINPSDVSFDELRQLAERYSLEQWTHQNRYIDGKPFTLETYPFMREIYENLSSTEVTSVVNMKPAQIGATQAGINLSFWFMQHCREGVLYLRESDDAISTFSTARLNLAIQESPSISEFFDQADNVGVKVGNNGTQLYLRGARQRGKLKEISVGLVVFDEFDEMNQEVCEYALNRMDASQYEWTFYLSNPTTPNFGIDRRYQNSSRGEWRFPCPNPSCARSVERREGQPVPPQWIRPDWKFVDFEAEAFLCPDCHTPVSKATMWQGDWLHRDPANPCKGYWLPQLLSPTIKIAKDHPNERSLIEAYQEAEGNPVKMQRFYNMVLGLPFEQGADRLEENDIRACMQEGFVMPKSWDQTKAVMGVDVNWPYLHYWIQTGNRVLKIGVAEGLTNLERIAKRFNVKVVVIDAQPERRMVSEWAAAMKDENIRVYRWFHTEASHAEPQAKKKEFKVLFNKTELLDQWIGQFFEVEASEDAADWKHRIIMPANPPNNAIDQMTSPQRKIEETRTGPKAVYEPSGDDHYADAGAYARLAQELRPGVVHFGFA